MANGNERRRTKAPGQFSRIGVQLPGRSPAPITLPPPVSPGRSSGPPFRADVGGMLLRGFEQVAGDIREVGRRAAEQEFLRGEREAGHEFQREEGRLDRAAAAERQRVADESAAQRAEAERKFAARMEATQEVIRTARDAANAQEARVVDALRSVEGFLDQSGAMTPEERSAVLEPLRVAVRDHVENKGRPVGIVADSVGRMLEVAGAAPEEIEVAKSALGGDLDAGEGYNAYMAVMATKADRLVRAGVKQGAVNKARTVVAAGNLEAMKAKEQLRGALEMVGFSGNLDENGMATEMAGWSGLTKLLESGLKQKTKGEAFRERIPSAETLMNELLVEAHPGMGEHVGTLMAMMTPAGQADEDRLVEAFQKVGPVWGMPINQEFLAIGNYLEDLQKEGIAGDKFQVRGKEARNLLDALGEMEVMARRGYGRTMRYARTPSKQEGARQATANLLEALTSIEGVDAAEVDEVTREALGGAGVIDAVRSAMEGNTLFRGADVMATYGVDLLDHVEDEEARLAVQNGRELRRTVRESASRVKHYRLPYTETPRMGGRGGGASWGPEAGTVGPGRTVWED